MQGTTYVYNNIIRPYIASNETDIDRTILELRTRTADSVIVFLREFTAFGQAKFFEIMNYVVSHSKTRPADHSALNREEEYLRRTEVPSVVPTRKHKAERETKQKLRRGHRISNSIDDTSSSNSNDSSESDRETTKVGITKRSTKSKKTDE